VPELSPESSWSAAVDLGARGRYADAADLLDTLTARGVRWSSLSLSTLASHRRQIGDVTEAARLDAASLRDATDEESRADALVGLAADAVAAGDAKAARERHRAAERDARAAWRTLTRWHWVGAELSLLVGDRDAAADHAHAALKACGGRSPRHVAKTRIVLAAVTGDVAGLDAVSATLADEGWVTLAWPLALVAADHAGAESPPWLGSAWEAGLRAVDVIEVGLPIAQRAAWQAHPGVRRLREERSHSGGG